MIYSTKTSWIVIIGFIIVGFGVSTCAHAGTYILAGVGQSKALLAHGTAQGDIAWQQRGFPHSEHLTNTAYSLGLGYSFRPWIAVELSQHHLGKVSQTGEWLYNDDGSISSPCPCVGSGSATVKGQSLAVVLRYPMKVFSIGIEAGAFNWQSSWKETIHLADGSIAYHDPVKTKGLGALTGVVFGYRAFDIRYETFHVQPRDGIFDRMQILRAVYKFNF